jgi:hypothetical protein
MTTTGVAITTVLAFGRHRPLLCSQPLHYESHENPPEWKDDNPSRS